jgi:hypothetical protein
MPTRWAAFPILLASCLLLGSAAAPAPAATPEELLQSTCGGCHPADAQGRLSRIAEQRKTPEGWAMTIQRMQDLHAVSISSQELPLGSSDVVRTLVKHLADTQGLAPEEAAGFRYALEQRLDDFEPVDADFKTMCGRCHSAARVLLQRRPTEEWGHLVHFHVGQFPSTEYSAGGRDRDWLPIALEKTAPMLAEKYPFASEAWAKWRAAPKPALAGEWRVAGWQPSKGDFSGTLRATSDGADRYALAFAGAYAGGERLVGSGSALVYTGYEWRGNLELGGVAWRQILAASADGKRLDGRMFERAHPELGLDFAAVRAGSGLALPGERAAPAVTLGAGRVDRVSVEPAYQVARVGDGGGPLAKELAVFDAIAWSNGPDGRPSTADDVRLGVVPARWSVEPWHEQAREERDVEFAGVMDAATGVFTPGDAGPNPARKYGTNNAGNLKVIATLQDGARTLTGDAHLIVTVQRWINPPIP